MFRNAADGSMSELIPWKFSKTDSLIEPSAAFPNASGKTV